MSNGFRLNKEIIRHANSVLQNIKDSDWTLGQEIGACRYFWTYDNGFITYYVHIFREPWADIVETIRIRREKYAKPRTLD